LLLESHAPKDYEAAVCPNISGGFTSFVHYLQTPHVDKLNLEEFQAFLERVQQEVGPTWDRGSYEDDVAEEKIHNDFMESVLSQCHPISGISGIYDWTVGDSTYYDNSEATPKETSWCPKFNNAGCSWHWMAQMVTVYNKQSKKIIVYKHEEMEAQ